MENIALNQEWTKTTSFSEKYPPLVKTIHFFLASAYDTEGCHAFPNIELCSSPWYWGAEKSPDWHRDPCKGVDR